ncbi:MAG: response regulator [Puia sp.]|nr:response regulator [Puia sp.]
MANKTKNILIVDDSPLILERISQMIRRFGKEWNPLLAGTFSDALDFLQTSKINAAIFDIHLQENNGIELLRRAIRLHPNLFAIILTNQANNEVKSICIGIGAKHFLDKSLEFHRIPQIISTLN